MSNIESVDKLCCSIYFPVGGGFPDGTADLERAIFLFWQYPFTQ